MSAWRQWAYRTVADAKVLAMRVIAGSRAARGLCPIASVAVETTQHCNRRCSYCPVSIAPKPVRAMDRSLFDLIVRQLHDARFDGRLAYHFYNEPLLDPDLESLVRHAAARLPRASHAIYTNGDLLTEARLEALLVAGVTHIVITDHGGKPLTSAVRRISSRPTSDRRIRFRRVDADTALFNRGGTVEVSNPRHLSYCAYPAYEMNIDVDGNVLLCCNDYFGEHRFGNVRDTPLLDIWTSPAMTRIREQLLEGRFERDLCRRCAGISS